MRGARDPVRLYPVNEVFQTVQGEGSFTGTPATFIRMQGCDIGCPWCDTKHTWERRAEERFPLPVVASKTEVASRAWADATVEQLVAQAVERFTARHVVITGGEPCTYDLEPLTGALLARGLEVQVETSGTYPVRVADGTFVTVSPKVGMPGGREVLRDVVAACDELKLPIGRARDYERFADLIDLVPGHAVVYLQPLSQSPAATRACVDLATAHGHRVSVQVHKYLGLR